MTGTAAEERIWPNDGEFKMVVGWWRGERTGSMRVTSGNALDPSTTRLFSKRALQLPIFGRCAEVGTAARAGLIPVTQGRYTRSGSPNWVN